MHQGIMFHIFSCSYIISVAKFDMLIYGLSAKKLQPRAK